MTARFYVVGGAVRDALLGLPASDRDWVAVGANPDELLAQGYRPVGKDFPVFLHPTTGEEVALARTERKSGRGYRGFTFHAAPEVTLEQDLARRDLTINAIAQAADGTLIDPHGGQRDIEARLLRHVSAAFVEDPVRLLRVARLAARLPQFSVAPETLALMAQMVANGEIDALVPERVWQELSRGLMTARPSRMIEVLRDCGALDRLLPEVDKPAAAMLKMLDEAAARDAPLSVRYACLMLDTGSSAALNSSVAAPPASAHDRLKVPTDCREMATLLAREGPAMLRTASALGAAEVVQLFERCDAWRRPERFAALLVACECVAAARPEAAGAASHASTLLLERLLSAARAVDSGAAAAAAAREGKQGPEIGAAVMTARVAAVGRALGAATAG